MPLATQAAGDDYDVLIAIDENEIFGEYLPFNPFAPRPVAGTHGLVPMAWHRVQEQWGSTQIQHRFIEVAAGWRSATTAPGWACAPLARRLPAPAAPTSPSCATICAAKTSRSVASRGSAFLSGDRKSTRLNSSP